MVTTSLPRRLCAQVSKEPYVSAKRDLQCQRRTDIPAAPNVFFLPQGILLLRQQLEESLLPKNKFSKVSAPAQLPYKDTIERTFQMPCLKGMVLRMGAAVSIGCRRNLSGASAAVAMRAMILSTQALSSCGESSLDSDLTRGHCSCVRPWV